MKTKTLALLSILLLSGCATKRPPPAVEAPPPEPATELLPAWPGLGDADRTVLLGGWESEARTDHPLVGTHHGDGSVRGQNHDTRVRAAAYSAAWTSIATPSIAP